MQRDYTYVSGEKSGGLYVPSVTESYSRQVGSQAKFRLGSKFLKLAVSQNF